VAYSAAMTTKGQRVMSIDVFERPPTDAGECLRLYQQPRRTFRWPTQRLGHFRLDAACRPVRLVLSEGARRDETRANTHTNWAN
jgi:hypothetical protein